ncbi:MAG TPA: hypothetical protein PK005_00795 [Bacteroidales bacterium]|jgi:hypothetical protein|nr:hypothetical protein [Bacteroidales bacterium]MDI9532116.1 hypothetical protein [Bacteroidota bacterium]OPZ57701.1 MAG: hypothetical protein BWY89_00483 [Bacteroidetes bacterium ADurb.BinA012]MBK7731352.1 hypothetical protein [Bacteroidales bacterium]MBP7035177.1 hypothetical protein [Bacteroidales bacterium]
MRQLIQILMVTLFLSLLVPGEAAAQCKGFAKSLCKTELGDYLHDGNYHAAVLVEGEEAELYKTFYSDLDYRLAICSADGMPPVEFIVYDATGKVLYNNKDEGPAKTWDFRLESSQQLKVVVKVSTFGSREQLPVSGCVAIMFGFKAK